MYLKMNKYYYFHLLLLFMITSCCNVDNDITVDFKDETTANLLDSVSDLRIVLLENNEDALLCSVDQVFYNNGCFVIYDDDNQLISKFNNDGTFVNTIGQQGQGPSEYVSTSSIDVYDGKICFSDYGNKTLLFDVCSSKLIKTFDYLGEQVAFSGKDGYVVFNSMTSDKVDKYLSFYDNEFRMYKDSIGIYFSSGYQFDPLSKFFRHNDTLYCCPILDNTVYAVSNNCCSPYETLGFGKYRMPNKSELSRMGNDEGYKDFMKSDDDFIHGFEPVVADGYVAVRYWTSKRTFVGFFNTITRTSFYQETTRKQEENFMYWIKGSYGDSFISPMIVSDLRESEMLKTNSSVQKFLDNNLDADDESVVLIIWKFK